MAEEYVILGAGGHARVVLDALELNKKEIIGLTDHDLQPGDRCKGYEILGTDDVLGDLYKNGIRCAAMGIGHVGEPAVRNHVYQIAQEIGFVFPNIIHPTALQANSVIVGTGNLFLANSVVNDEAKIGNLCIINTSAVIEHEVIIGDGVHIAPNATILGRAQIGSNTFIGAGSVILQGVHVGADCIIGAGSIVLHDVEDHCVVVGNPGRILRRKD